MLILNEVSAGAAAGGIVGVLIGAGLPDNAAKAYEKELKEENALLALKTKPEEETQQMEDKLRNPHDYPALREFTVLNAPRVRARAFL